MLRNCFQNCFRSMRLFSTIVDTEREGTVVFEGHRWRYFSNWCVNSRLLQLYCINLVLSGVSIYFYCSPLPSLIDICL